MAMATVSDPYIDPTHSRASMPVTWSRRNWAMRQMLQKALPPAEKPRAASRFGWSRFWKRVHGAQEQA